MQKPAKHAETLMGLTVEPLERLIISLLYTIQWPEANRKPVTP